MLSMLLSMLSMLCCLCYAVYATVYAFYANVYAVYAVLATVYAIYAMLFMLFMLLSMPSILPCNTSFCSAGRVLPRSVGILQLALTIHDLPRLNRPLTYPNMNFPDSPFILSTSCC